MTILDSNVWIALFNERDSQHAKAQKVIPLIALPVIMPEYIILEVCSVLVQKASKEVADRFLDRVCDNADIQILYCDEQQFNELCTLFRQSTHRKLSFIDSVLLHLAKEYLLITFDATLHKVAATVKRGNH